ncbi:TPA: plasmid mobilization protein MobA [Salmonella enterica]
MSKSEKRNRTALLPSVRCLPEEKEAIQEKAKAAGLSLGEFLRRSALGRRIDAQCDTEMIMELRRLGGLQKHLFKEGNGLLSKEYSQVLVALQKALLRVGQG